MSNPLGQIQIDSAFGTLLTELARENEIVVEIGTWHGEGSTRCLALGLVRPSQRFYSIEAQAQVLEAVKARYHDDRIIWLNGTVSPMNDAPIIIEQLPASIDLLLIDGGEDNGWLDYVALRERAKIIAIDDTNEQCRKGKRARADMIERGWKVIADRLNDRNGWAVFEKPETCALAST